MDHSIEVRRPGQVRAPERVPARQIGQTTTTHRVEQINPPITAPAAAPVAVPAPVAHPLTSFVKRAVIVACAGSGFTTGLVAGVCLYKTGGPLFIMWSGLGSMAVWFGALVLVHVIETREERDQR